jgi:hypothetical protein
LVALAAAALLTATPGVAAAASTPPQPRVEDLRTGNAACAQGDSAPYVASEPPLEVTLRNPDSWARAGAEIEMWWTDAEGTAQRETLTSTASIPGTPFRLTPSFEIPTDTLVSWRARAVDGQGATSPWSDEGDGHLCQFVIDADHPEPATVTSDRYDDTAWHDGVGVYGGFTFDSPSDDVVGYRYRFLGGSTHRIAEPEEMGGPVTVRYMPQAERPDHVTVQAVDRAGNPSAPVTYDFRVSDGRSPVAHWELTGTSAEAGPALRAENGATFQDDAPYGTGLAGSVRLSGEGDGYLTPDAPVADTAKTFALGGWVRPGRTDRAMTVASQDAADGTSAFTLGLRPTGDGDAEWAFAFGGATVAGGGPEPGDWAHVLGVFDTEDDTLRLYVNGKAVDGDPKATPTAAPGAFQLGRARGDGGRRWEGDLADVRVWDRVVVPAEAKALGARQPQRVGGWDFESATDEEAPGSEGGPLALRGGATVHRYADDPDCWLDPDCAPTPSALMGDAHLVLDGATGHAVAGGPVADTSGSFTVGAYVQLADEEPTGPMTVLSQGGEHGDAFKVRYDPAGRQWQLVVTDGDASDANRTVASVPAPSDWSGPTGHQIVVVHDDTADTVALYVDRLGSPGGPVSFDAAWEAGGPLQVGRGRTADGWSEYFNGAVDHIRVYTGALATDDFWRLTQ